MKLFGSRRSRSAKAASLKAASSFAGRISGQLSNSESLLRLSLCVVALASVLLLGQGWKTPFPFRLGHYCPDGVLARIDFERENKQKTDTARLERESNVPLVFLNDPEPLRRLPYLLREHLFDIAGVEKLSQLRAETVSAFGFSTRPGENLEQLSPELRLEWDLLKKRVGPKATAEGRIDELLVEFNQFTAPLRTTGVLEPAELTRRDLREDENIEVISAENPSERNQIAAADGLLTEMLKPASGRLGREWKAFPALMAHQSVLERWLVNRTPVTLRYDEARTEQARLAAGADIKPFVDTFKRGSVLVAPGTWITADSLPDLQSQYDAIEARVPLLERFVRLITGFTLLGVLASIMGYYLTQNAPKLALHAGRLTVYLFVFVITVALGRAMSFDPWRAEVIPLLCSVIVLAIAYNQVLAALTGFAISLVLTLSIGGGLGHFVVLMSASAMAVVPLSQVETRSKIVKVGFWTAAIYLIVTWGVGVLETQRMDRLWTDQNLLIHGLRGAGWCLAAGYLVAGSLPFIESTFGVVTDISLLELGDVSHPLLQELVRRAPGTYSHSVGVATIAETAADAIGANGLLCRVGAYFHDIGKMLKPQYFVENMSAGAVSRHESLAPAMSTLIIIGHVKDGVDLARQHNLPEPLVDFIEQHHGTTLVEYFFHQATKQAESKRDQGIEVEESSFRYPGAKPQSREAGVLMLADAVEGASRALSEPTPKRIETLVHEIMLKRLLDGQFEESTLTLSELSVIEDSLTKSLISIYHGRIKYPEQRSA